MARVALLAALYVVPFAAACSSARPAPPADRAGSLYVRGTVVLADGSTLPGAAVHIEGNRIRSVSADPVPEGARVIGGPDKWIIAGLIDAHVHFFQSGGLYTRPDVIDLTGRVPYAEETRRIRQALPDTLRRYLRGGITSAVDCGGPNWNFEVREQANHTALAPRLAVAGPLLAPVARPQLDLGDAPIVQVADAAAARAMVREQAAHKPDFIKLWWRLSPGESAQTWQPVARAAIEEAHAQGLRAFVHATQLEVARAALESGADVLVHSVFDADVDDAFLKLLHERHAIYITTLNVFAGYGRVLSQRMSLPMADMELADPAAVATVLEPFTSVSADSPYRRPPGPQAARNVKAVWESGAIVAAGSDAGNIGTFHVAGMHRELEELVAAGLTPAQALTAATANAAQVMGRTDLGAIEPGKLADLVVLSASPLQEIGNTRRIEWVVKDGVAYRPDEIRARSAAEIVQAQVNAYNAQDLEAFLSTYGSDAILARANGQQLESGREAFRARYGKMFARFPTNRVRIQERKTEGDGVVMDYEIITGRAPEHPDPWDVGWVRYEVAGGLIRKVVVP